MKKKNPEKFSRDWFVEQGKIGGYKTKALYGLRHYSKIRKKKVDNSLDNPPVKEYTK